MSRLLACLIVYGVLAGVGAGGARPDTVQAQGARAWDVLVGTEVEEEFISTQRYSPETLTIGVGDTVRFGWRGFHSVTFTGGRPLPPLVTPGSEAGTLVLNPELNFSSLPPGQMSTTYGGSEFINLLPEDGGGEDDMDAPPPVFTVTFTRSGSFAYYCAFHPGMRGAVDVAPAGAPLPETPAEAQARGQAELEMTIMAMRAATAQARPAQPEATEAAGRTTVHSALAGLGSGFAASLLAFLPDALSVRRGDLVVWTMPDPYEIHTITFTSGATPPEFVEPQFGMGGPAAGPPSLVIPANVAGRAGGDTYRGSGYVNSGILGPGQSFALRFDAPAGTYEYVCVVHPFMRGAVAVTEP